MKYAGIARIAGLILVTILSIVEDVEATRSVYDATRYEKIIVPQVAGQLLRQPSAEEKWQEMLLSLPALNGFGGCPAVCSGRARSSPLGGGVYPRHLE